MSAIDDKEKVDRKELKWRVGRRRELEDIAFVLSTPEGRRFYWRIMEKCGLHRSSFGQGSTNTICFNEGERNIGLLLLADLEEADPQAYVKCLSESKTEEIKNG